MTTIMRIVVELPSSARDVQGKVVTACANKSPLIKDPEKCGYLTNYPTAKVWPQQQHKV